MQQTTQFIKFAQKFPKWEINFGSERIYAKTLTEKNYKIANFCAKPTVHIGKM